MQGTLSHVIVFVFAFDKRKMQGRQYACGEPKENLQVGGIFFGKVSRLYFCL